MRFRRAMVWILAAACAACLVGCSRRVCRVCGGSGRFNDHPCTVCRGLGWESAAGFALEETGDESG